jgi:hypothetical protein
MKLLAISKLDKSSQGVSTITRYAQAAKALGHELAVFSEQRADFPSLPTSLEVKGFDYAIFIVYETKDFPDLPYLARLLDGMPKDRRVVIDCYGRYNDTIRVEHDFNHLEKLDGHQDWEWTEGFEALSDRILQPTLSPRRPNVRSFLFHGFDAAAVARPYTSADEAARAWAGESGRPYEMTYVGHNWQRWSQIRPFLEALVPLRPELGPICLAGWRWDQREDWAKELGIQGVDVDPELLKRAGVETRWPVPHHEVIDFMGQGRFCPVFHRPLFNHLGLVGNRTFETFCADTIPLLMLPQDFVEAIYGSAAKPLMPGDDVAGRIQDMRRRPEYYWDAVLKVRAHLAECHSIQRRFKELLAILEDK